MVPHVVAGGGPLISMGDPVTLKLTGDYRFVSGSNTPYGRRTPPKSDSSPARCSPHSSVPVSRGRSTRAPVFEWDFRALFASDPLKVLLNSNPVTIPGLPTNTIVLGGTPAIQISTSGAFQSTLGYLRASEDVEISPADGMRPRANLTVGYYYGFSSRQAQPSSTATQRTARDTRFDSKRRWEVEFNVEACSGPADRRHRIASFPVGAAFTSARARHRGLLPAGCSETARCSSIRSPQPWQHHCSGSNTPLDSVLTAASLERGAGRASAFCVAPADAARPRRIRDGNGGRFT
jgi:hypothetical protein